MMAPHTSHSPAPSGGYCSPLARVAGEQGRTVMDQGDAAAERGVVLHLCSLFTWNMSCPSLERVMSLNSASPPWLTMKRDH